MGSPAVVDDLKESNGRDTCPSYVKKLGDAVGVLARAKQKSWNYEDPIDIEPEEVATLSLGLDGTCMHLVDGGGWREAMAGTISMYDGDGERLHTIYLGSAPEYGKEAFLEHLDSAWEKAQKRYPNATTQGLADGAPWIWKWLNERTEFQVLDFYHMSEYVSKAASALYKSKGEQEAFKEEWLHYIKHHCRGVYKLIEELEGKLKGKLPMAAREALLVVVEYLRNQAHRPEYLTEIQANRPIGSGVTEAACKRLVKARMCQSGMRWKYEGAANIIALRALVLTIGQWDQFWQRMIRYGGYLTLRATNN
jgi:hypothetical protein